MAFDPSAALESRGRYRSTRLPTALLGILLAVLGRPISAFAAGDPPWLLVDTARLTLTVMRSNEPHLTLHNLSIGRAGATMEKYRGDNMTPVGRFRVTHIESDTPFHRFVGLSYPDVERANTGRTRSAISEQEFQAIESAHRVGKAPPQNTSLGGHIGIHGVGRANPEIHEAMNWTRGCVALTDRQIDSLMPWLEVGMVVEIR